MSPEFGTTIGQLPLSSPKRFSRSRCHEPLDGRFLSAARLLQSIWREDRSRPISSYAGEDRKRRKLGSRISGPAGRAGFNFLTPEIAQVVRRDIAYREIVPMIDEERLPQPGLSNHRDGALRGGAGEAHQQLEWPPGAARCLGRSAAGQNL